MLSFIEKSTMKERNVTTHQSIPVRLVKSENDNLPVSYAEVWEHDDSYSSSTQPRFCGAYEEGIWPYINILALPNLGLKNCHQKVEPK
jgi:hypothetical protein